MIPRIRSLSLLVLALLLMAVPASAQGISKHYLVLVPADRASALVASPQLRATVLARLPGDGNDSLLLRVNAAQNELLALHRIPGRELPSIPADAALFLIDGTARPVAGAELSDWNQFGHILWQGKDQVVLQGTPERLYPLLQLGYRLLPLNQPIALQSRPHTLPPPPTTPDPLISDALARLSSTAIAGWIRKLSGEEWVNVGSNQLKFTSRYSWSTLGRRSERYVYERLQSMGYNVAYAPYTTPYNDTWRNVVAEIPGAIEPDKIVMLVAHLDSISFPLENAATQAPGADDNATGASALLAIADVLREQHFAYTLRLVWFTGEEFGYWGSRPYVQALAAADANIIAAIDLDMFGYDGDQDRVVEMHTGDKAINNELGDQLAAANQLYQLGLEIERKTTSASRFSDHRSFWEQGYPALMLIENFFADSDEDTHGQDRNPQYHKTGDQAALIDFDYAADIARMALAAAMNLAHPLSPGQLPTPSPTSTPLPAECSQLLANGDMEQTSDWHFGSTPRAAGYSQAQAHSGSRSLRSGIVPPTGNTISHSSAFQAINLPGDAADIRLSLWMLGDGADSNDYSEVLLLRPNLSVRRLLWRQPLHTLGWEQKTFDLSPYAGEGLLLYLNTYNDGNDGRAWAYFDDVSVVACPPGAVDSTPTSSPSPTVPISSPTPTLTSTPTPTATPTTTTLTPTPTPSPTATSSPPATMPTPTPTATPSPTSTPTSTPTPLPTPACQEQLINPDFETDNGWIFARTASRGDYSSEQAHHGLRSARLGLLPTQDIALRRGEESNLLGEKAPDGSTYSTVYQYVKLPLAAETIQLRGWFWPQSQATANDWQRILILDSATLKNLRTLYHDLQALPGWSDFTYDLSAFRGQEIVLYFEVYNNSTAADGRTWMFIDDLQLSACNSPFTPTPQLDRTLYLPLINYTLP